MPTAPEPKRDENDENTEVTELLAKVTQTPPPKGEDLLADPELQRQLREAKEREKKPNGSN